MFPLKQVSALSLAAICALTSLRADEQPVQAKLAFASGNTFSGSFQGGSESGLIVKNPSVANPVTLKTENLLKVTLNHPDSKLKPISSNHEATIFIKGRYGQEQASDQIKGELKQITDDTITLGTQFAGDLIIQRKFITNLEIDSEKSNLYSGPTSLDEWILPDSDEAWSFRDNALIGSRKSGHAAKDVNLADLSHISLDIDWKSSLNFRMFLFSDDPKSSRPKNYFELVMRSNYVYMRKYAKDGGGSNSLDGSISIRQLAGVDTALIEIFADKNKGLFHLYIDGDKITTFNDRVPGAEGFGPAIHFINEERTPSRIRNIRIARWSGMLPTKQDVNDFEKLKGPGQRIMLKNGDAILGKLGDIKNDILNIETKYTPVRVPVAGMRTIQMKMAFDKVHSPIMKQGDIKAYFREGGWIILKLESISADSITGFHQAFGSKKFDLNAFRSIEFNIYNDKLNADRTSTIW